jgi:hypothetical protein
MLKMFYEVIIAFNVLMCLFSFGCSCKPIPCTPKNCQPVPCSSTLCESQSSKVAVIFDGNDKMQYLLDSSAQIESHFLNTTKIVKIVEFQGLKAIFPLCLSLTPFRYRMPYSF